MDLQKRNSVLCSFLLYFLRPQGNMYLTDVSLAQEEHTDTGLSDTAADGVWKLLVQDGFLEWKLSSVIASGFCKLFVKCRFVYTDTHGGKLKGMIGLEKQATLLFR